MIQGGSFHKGMRMIDYWSNLNDEDTFVVHDLFMEVLPLMYDGYNMPKNLFTARGIADFTAMLHAELEDKDYSYLDFYSPYIDDRR